MQCSTRGDCPAQATKHAAFRTGHCQATKPISRTVDTELKRGEGQTCSGERRCEQLIGETGERAARRASKKKKQIAASVSTEEGRVATRTRRMKRMKEKETSHFTKGLKSERAASVRGRDRGMNNGFVEPLEQHRPRDDSNHSVKRKASKTNSTK